MCQTHFGMGINFVRDLNPTMEEEQDTAIKKGRR